MPRAWVESSNLQRLGVQYLEVTIFHPKFNLLKASSFNSVLQPLNSFSKYKVAMLKVTYEGRNDTKQSSIHDKQKNAWKPIALGPTKWELKLSDHPKLPPVIEVA